MTHLDLQNLAQRVTTGDGAAAATLESELGTSLRYMARRALRGGMPSGGVSRLIRTAARAEPDAPLAERLSRRIVGNLRGLAGAPLAARETVLNSCFVA